jgi:hypothetical protein
LEPYAHPATQGRRRLDHASGLAALALAIITIGTLVVLPAMLESNGLEVRMPHVDETAPRVSAAQYGD